MVEFALIVPILLALLFGIISYGYMLSYRQAITQAATEGARFLALAAESEPDAEARAREVMNESLNSYNVQCTVAGVLQRTDGSQQYGDCTYEVGECEGSTAAASDQCVTVRITHDYRNNPLISSFPGLGITLPETITFASVMVMN